jgi:hypothetical protein
MRIAFFAMLFLIFAALTVSFLRLGSPIMAGMILARSLIAATNAIVAYYL